MPLAAALRATGIPHAIILGNHDAEARMTRSAVVAYDASLTGSITPLPQQVRGTPDAGNYWIDVLTEDGQQQALRLWMLDTMNRGCGGVPGWYDPALQNFPATSHCDIREAECRRCCDCKITDQHCENTDHDS